MSWEVMIALMGFSLATSITPGPNNMMLMTSGANYGFSRSLPHMFGVNLGFAFMLFCVGIGLGQLLERAPTLFLLMKLAGGAYLFYLAYRIATAGPMQNGGRSGRPMWFIEAVAFQWVNPKAWMMAITAMAAYTAGGDYVRNMLLVVVVFSILNLPCMVFWTGFGTVLRGLLDDPRWLRAFNIVMALLLVASLWPMLR